MKKIQEFNQDKHRNQFQSLEPLKKVLLQYTNLDCETLDREQSLMTYFSQNFLYFKVKRKHLEKGTLALQVEVIAMGFEVYHGKNKKGQKSKIPGAG